MKIHELLDEAVDNILSNDLIKRLNYANEVYDMLQVAYAPIGGLKGHGFTSVDDMIESIPFWKIAKRDGEVVAVLMYRDKAGRKRVAMATDGTDTGKREISNMLRDEYKTKRAYAEISDASLRFHRRILGDYLDEISIPAHMALEKLDTTDIRITDYYEYERLIGSEWITKRMVGNINAPSIESRH